MSATRSTARHGTGRVRRSPDMRLLARAAARSGAKCVVGVGLATGVGASVLAVAGDAAPDVTDEDLGLGTADAPSADVAAAVAARRDLDVSSRSAARTTIAPPTVVAPAWQAGVAGEDYGALDVSAVAKPDPGPSEPVDPSTAPVDPTPAPAPTDPYAAEARALGLGPNAQLVYSAVRTEFPSITDIGGYRPGDPGDHGTGHAVDIMCDTATGDAVAAYMQAHASELHIKYVIWKQRIWFPGTTTWRLMEDRGSVTANHYDHVHVSVY